jgi:hypothetical protein
MNRVFFYNPENDIALAHGQANFTAPKNAIALGRSCAAVMWWLADVDDFVLLPSDLTAEEFATAEQWHEQVSRAVGSGAKLVTSAAGLSVESAVPWGWSPYTVKRLQSAGVPTEAMTEINTDRLRELSHRRSASHINRALGETVNFDRYHHPIPEAATEATDIATVERYAATHSEFYCKMPWSSSGRGVRLVNATTLPQLRKQLLGMLKAQGSVLLEPAYHKRYDFAMLFEARGGEVRFYGYSLFFNAHGDAYGGNLIADDEAIKAELTKYVPEGLIDDIREALTRILADLTEGDYEGFMGVDMMIADGQQGQAIVVPCVELNLRTTMGVIAHSVTQRLRHVGISGRYVMQMTIGQTHTSANEVLALVPKNDMFNITLHTAER